MSAHWSLGVLIGLPVLGLLTLISTGLSVASFVAWRRDESYDADLWAWSALLCGLTAVGLIVGSLVGFYPFSAQYHRWAPKTGVVADVSSRFIGGDKGSTQKFVVEFADGQRYGCNDTRCSLVKAGDTLTLSCKRTWQYAGEDGWDCNYVRDEVAS